MAPVAVCFVLLSGKKGQICSFSVGLWWMLLVKSSVDDSVHYLLEKIQSMKSFTDIKSQAVALNFFSGLTDLVPTVPKWVRDVVTNMSFRTSFLQLGLVSSSCTGLSTIFTNPSNSLITLTNTLHCTVLIFISSLGKTMYSYLGQRLLSLFSVCRKSWPF